MKIGGMWRSIAVAVAVLALLVVAVGCGSDDEGSSGATGTTQAEEAPAKGELFKKLAAQAPTSEGPRGNEEVVAEVEITPEEAEKLKELAAKGPLKVGYATHILSVDFWKQVTDVFEKKVKEYLPNAEVVFTDGELKPDKQLTDIESLLAQKVDVAVIAPIDQDAATPALKRWNESGTKLIIHQTQVDESIKYDGFCGADNYLGGWLSGAYLADYLGGKGDVASIKFAFKLWHADLRNKGFEDAAKAGGLKVVAKGQALANDEGDATFQNLLTSNPSLVGGFGLWDGVGLGMAQAVQSLGRDDVAIVTHDLTTATALQIRDDGVIKATAVQLTDLIGENCAKVMLKVMAGTDMSNIAVVAEEVLATPENVEDYHKRLYGTSIDEASKKQ